MDPELQKRIDAARAQGFTDEEIQQALASDTGKSQQNEATMPGGYNVPILSAEEKARFQQNQAAVDAAAADDTLETGLIASGLAVAPYVLPATAAGIAALGAGKLYGAWNKSAEAAKDLAAAQMETEAGRANRAQMKMNPQQMRPAGTMGPATYNVPTQNVPQVKSPIAPTGATPTGPVVPQGMAAAAPARSTPSIMAQIRALAANKVLPAAGAMARGSVGPGLAMYSGELGPKTPQVGRMRGMEINPLTGRPWTPEQIRQYEANPSQFDSQMAPPQMRR